RGLLAEATPRVRSDHPHLVLVQAEMLAEVMTDDIGKLMAHPDGERERAFTIGGDAAAAFQAQRLFTADAELALDDEVRSLHRLFHIAALVFAFDEIIVRAAIVHQRRSVLLAHTWIRHHWQRIVIDLDEFDRVFGDRPTFGHHRADRFAAEAHLLDRQPVLHGFAAGEAIGHAAERLDLAEQFAA